MTEATDHDSSDSRLALQLQLTYRHGLGDAAPFFDALGRGKLLASRCPQCGDCRVPPRPICPIDHIATELVELSGEGRLLRVTPGPASSLLGETESEPVFGEIAVDGASNRLVARIDADASKLRAGCRVQLAESSHGPVHPIQALVFEPTDR